MLNHLFTCNICGSERLRFTPVGDWSEAASCVSCGSSVRMRSIVHCLTLGLLGSSQVLNLINPRPEVGVGLSDWDGYASILSDKFSYVNTFYHQSPYLDIAAPEPKWLGSCDFLISTDVFEHVPSPVENAFIGSINILRAGGLLVMTAPYGENTQTIEHYPSPSKYAVVEIDNEYLVVIKNKKGDFYVDSSPIFHGGPGSNLELRQFSLKDILGHLERAGFVEITVHDEAVPGWGIFPPHKQGLPITARKPC